MRKTIGIILLCAPLMEVSASDLIYQPYNPSFGGNPMNGSVLLSNAQAQNNKKDPDRRSSGRESTSKVDRFASSLQSSLLYQLLSDVGGGETGRLVTDEFIVDIADDGAGGLVITLTDQETAETATIEVDGLNPDNN